MKEVKIKKLTRTQLTALLRKHKKLYLSVRSYPDSDDSITTRRRVMQEGEQTLWAYQGSNGFRTSCFDVFEDALSVRDCVTRLFEYDAPTCEEVRRRIVRVYVKTRSGARKSVWSEGSTK